MGGASAGSGSKKRSKNKVKAEKRVKPETKKKAKDKARIQQQVAHRSSKARAKAVSQKASGDGDALDDVNSVDALFAKEFDDSGAEQSGDGSSDGEGAFQDVDNGDDGQDDLPFDDLDDDEDGEDTGARHEKELSSIKEKDPEFYKFLVENDKSLLDFRAPPQEDKDDEEEEDDAGEAGEEAQTQVQQQAQKVLTSERFRSIRESAMDSFTACKFVLNAYHMAVRSIEGQTNDESGGEEDEDGVEAGEDEQAKRRRRRGLLKIDSEGTFSEVLEWGVANLIGHFKHHAGEMKSEGSKRSQKREFKHKKPSDETSKLVDPTLFSRWPRVKVIAQIFWEETLFLLNHLTDSQMLEYVLRAISTPEALAWLWPFKSIRLRYFKRCCALWSSSASHSVRVLSFLFIRNSAAMAVHGLGADQQRDMPMLESMTRSVLKSFSEAVAVGYSWRSVSTCRFMENCIVELLRMDDAVAYRVGYVWIRQLALILRNATIAASQVNQQGKKEGEKGKKRRAAQQQAMSLIGWPFIRSIYLWTKAVGTLAPLRPLGYPLSMIILGATKSKISSLQHFPFVFHCIRCLNRLGSSLEVFVPVSSHLLKVFSVLLQTSDKTHKKQRKQGGAEKGSSTLNATKAPDLEILLRLSDAQVSEGLCLEAIGGSVCFLLSDHLGLLSRSPAFPELSALVLTHLRKNKKHCRSEPLRRQLQSLITAAEASVEDVRARRDQFPEGKLDTPALKKFLVFEADTALAKARANLLQTRAAEEKLRVEAEQQQTKKAATKTELSEEVMQAKRDKKKRKRDRQKTEKLDAKKPRPAAEGLVASSTPGKDVVEEMGFSSGED